IGIASHKVAGHDGSHCSYQMERAAAVAAFIVLINAAAGLEGLAVRAKAAGRRPRERQARGFVVVYDVIVADGDVRSADHEDPFVESVLHGESGNRHIVEAGFRETVY